MAKAVLIMDMPEQVCQKCTLCYETENDDEYLCCATMEGSMQAGTDA